MQVLDEGIKNKTKYSNIPPLSNNEITTALDFIVKKIEANLEDFTYAFPSPSSKKNVYNPIENVTWTTGFWTGMIWLAYEYYRR